MWMTKPNKADDSFPLEKLSWAHHNAQKPGFSAPILTNE